MTLRWGIPMTSVPLTKQEIRVIMEYIDHELYLSTKLSHTEKRIALLYNLEKKLKEAKK